MRPGGWHAVPMLGADESLEELLAADARRLAGLGVDARTLGTRLGDALAAAAGSDWGRPAAVDGLRVELHRNRGVTTCPWAPGEHESCGRGSGGRGAGANEFSLRSEAGEQVDGFVLGAHLIAEHGFFGGRRTRFRIEPDQLASALGETV
jgi:hypothetical protein